MAMSDPLGDMLARIRNGQRARFSKVSAPASKLRSSVLEVLKREGYIRGYYSTEVRPGIAELEIELKYTEGEPPKESRTEDRGHLRQRRRELDAGGYPGRAGVRGGRVPRLLEEARCPA
jgi:hypothetical protein